MDGEPAKASDWRITPAARMRPLDFELVLDPARAERLLHGTVPREMEDKWFVYAEGDHLNFHRSWTGHLVFRLTVERAADGVRLSDAQVNDDPAQYTGDDTEAKQLLGWLVEHLADR
jgi:hypothetical protein